MTLSGIIVHYFPKMSSILAKNILLYTNEQLEQFDSELSIFLNNWQNSSKTIEVRTSGSTGNPKIIELEKSAVVNSAKATNLFFNLTKNSIFLHCLPVRFIAGKMMVVRALQANGRILFASSFANPLENLNQPIDFCAMTAHQLKKSILKNKDKFNWIKTLIIGGGPIEKDVEKILVSLPSRCFHTFGMTETISHFAVREISTVQQKPIFKCLPNVTIKTNLNHQLIVRAEHLYIKELITNDIVELIDANSFVWKGRIDNVINSGGIKIHPEELEKKISLKNTSEKFIFDKLKDDLLGEQLIMITNNQSKTDFASVFNSFQQHEIPKRIYKVNEFAYTENNKIDRPKSKEIAINLNKWYRPYQ